MVQRRRKVAAGLVSISLIKSGAKVQIIPILKRAECIPWANLKRYLTPHYFVSGFSWTMTFAAVIRLPPINRLAVAVSFG